MAMSRENRVGRAFQTSAIVSSLHIDIAKLRTAESTFRLTSALDHASQSGTAQLSEKANRETAREGRGAGARPPLAPPMLNEDPAGRGNRSATGTALGEASLNQGMSISAASTRPGRRGLRRRAVAGDGGTPTWRSRLCR